MASPKAQQPRALSVAYRVDVSVPRRTPTGGAELAVHAHDPVLLVVASPDALVPGAAALKGFARLLPRAEDDGEIRAPSPRALVRRVRAAGAPDPDLRHVERSDREWHPRGNFESLEGKGVTGAQHQ